MRAAIVIAAILLALPVAADPQPIVRPPIARPGKTIIIKLQPRTVVLVDQQQLPRVTLQQTTLTLTPPPTCKKDRRGVIHCRVTH